MADTPEAVLQTFNPLARANYQPPDLVLAPVNTTNRVYDEKVELRCYQVFIHNLGITPVKYAINQTLQYQAQGANTIATEFHGVLNGGTAIDDGNGAKFVFDIQKYGIFSIDVGTDTGTLRVAVEKMPRPDRDKPGLTQ